MSSVFLAVFLFLLLGGSSYSSSPEISDQKRIEKTLFSYQVKEHNGAPALLIDGKPVFYGIWWVAAPEKDQWIRADFARENAEETDIHIYVFDLGRHEWAGPG